LVPVTVYVYAVGYRYLVGCVYARCPTLRYLGCPIPADLLRCPLQLIVVTLRLNLRLLVVVSSPHTHTVYVALLHPTPLCPFGLRIALGWITVAPLPVG